MIQEILSNPVKQWMLAALVVMTVGGVIGLVVMWKKAIKESRGEQHDPF